MIRAYSRVECLGKYVGFGWELEKQYTWGLKASPIFFNGYSYSRTVACCGYLTSNQNALMCTTHIEKVIDKLYSFTLWSKIIDKQP